MSGADLTYESHGYERALVASVPTHIRCVNKYIAHAPCASRAGGLRISFSSAPEAPAPARAGGRLHIIILRLSCIAGPEASPASFSGPGGGRHECRLADRSVRATGNTTTTRTPYWSSPLVSGEPAPPALPAGLASIGDFGVALRAAGRDGGDDGGHALLAQECVERGDFAGHELAHTGNLLIYAL